MVLAINIYSRCGKYPSTCDLLGESMQEDCVGVFLLGRIQMPIPIRDDRNVFSAFVKIA